MNFCPKCGRESKHNENFCANCGSSIPKSKFKFSLKSNDKFIILVNFLKKYFLNLKEYFNDEEKKVKMKNFFKSKKFIVSTSVVTILFMIGFSSNMILKYLNKPSKVVEKFESLVKSKNIEELKLLFVDETFDFSGEEFPLFIEYISQPENYSYILKSLKDDANSIEGQLSDSDIYVTENNINDNINLVKDENNKYAISIEPVYFNINIPKSNTKVLLNDKEIMVTKENDYNLKLGPLFPGNYKINAVFENEFTTINDEKIIDTLKDNNNLQTSFDINLMQNSLNFVYLTSTYPEAKIYVNGKDTGLSPGPNGIEFGPISPNSKIQAILDVNGKQFKSEEIKYTAETYNNEIFLKFNTDQIDNDPVMKSDSEIRDIIHSLLENYLKNFAMAVNYDDFSRIEVYLDPGSPFFLEQKSVITSIHEQGTTENFVAFKLNDLIIDENRTSLTAKVQEIFDITYADYSKTTKSFNTEYKLVYNPDKKAYLISQFKILE